MSNDLENPLGGEGLFNSSINSWQQQSYSNVDNMLEGYKIKSALPFKIFSTLIMMNKNDVYVPRLNCHDKYFD
jgi:hypothetical protein